MFRHHEVKCPKTARVKKVNEIMEEVSSSGKGNDDEGFVEVRNKRVEQQKVGNKQNLINQVRKNEVNGKVINNLVYRPKVINSDKRNKGGFAKVNNVGVIGQKLKNNEQLKNSSKIGEKNQSSTTRVSQSNKFSILNDYEEGECVLERVPNWMLQES
ncbi:hypothetical protein Tco_1326135 [Tanacetum coccineum]